MQAVEVEARRQIEIYQSGGDIAQETRLFDTQRGVTRSMRSKEDAHDYRYFPDPDLPPLVLDAAWVEQLRENLPELPDARRARYVAMGLTPYDAHVLTLDRETAVFFETMARGRDAKLAANWLTGDYFAALNRLRREIADPPVSSQDMGELLDLIADKTISGTIAKQVFEHMLAGEGAPGAIVDARGLRQVTDTGAIEAAIRGVMEANADKLAEYRSGKDKLFGFFVGQTMKAMGGRGNPAAVNELLKTMLAG